MNIDFMYVPKPKKNQVIVVNLFGKDYNEELVDATIKQFHTAFPDNEIICLFNETEEEGKKSTMGFIKDD